MKKPPLIWVLTGHRYGDNAQARALAEAVAAEAHAKIVEKTLQYNALRVFPNILIRSGTNILTPDSAGELSPPWPDLIIGVGRRSVPVARWIRQQGKGRARIVWLGRPRAPFAWFDLVLSTPQYGLPKGAGIMMLDLPPAAGPQNADDLKRWEEKFSALPRPWTAVLVGGARWPVHFDAADAARLGAAVEAARGRVGGAWIVSVSPRTGLRPARALHENLQKPGFFYYWRAGADPRDNPHRALLALADRFIVTSDSASMIAEAVRSGRPVSLFPMRHSPLAPRWRAEKGLARMLAERGLLTPPRDMRAFCENLTRRGMARWLGEEEQTPTASGRKDRELTDAARRIADWLRD